MTTTPLFPQAVLRLGTYKLPAAETALIQTLLRLYSSGAAGHWVYASAPPYDALLVDGSTPEGQSQELDRMAKVVFRLMRKSENSLPDQLERPIKPDRFQLWLQNTERDLQQSATTQPEAAVRYRLLRWPPASMLHSNEEYVRLATLLSRRFLSTQDLAAISRLPEADCAEFVRTLQSARLVRTNAHEAAAARASMAETAAPTPAPEQPPAAEHRRSFSTDLIQNIRKRLHF